MCVHCMGICMRLVPHGTCVRAAMCQQAGPVAPHPSAGSHLWDVWQYADRAGRSKRWPRWRGLAVPSAGLSSTPCRAVGGFSISVKPRLIAYSNGWRLQGAAGSPSHAVARPLIDHCPPMAPALLKSEGAIRCSTLDSLLSSGPIVRSYRCTIMCSRYVSRVLL